jgi:hypothetical protein
MESLVYHLILNPALNLFEMFFFQGVWDLYVDVCLSKRITKLSLDV